MASTNCAFCYCLTYIAEESSVLLKKSNKMYFFILNKRGGWHNKNECNITCTDVVLVVVSL